MTDEEIELLKNTLATDRQVVFFIEDNAYKVETVDSSPSSIEGHEDWEPGPVAYLRNNGYVALWNCEMNQFLTTQPLA